MSFVISNRQLQQVRKISEGGFAFVSVVRDAATREEFALKKMALQSRALKEMAEREIRVMEMLGTHEHIVQYYGRFGRGGCGHANARHARAHRALLR